MYNVQYDANMLLCVCVCVIQTSFSTEGGDTLSVHSRGSSESRSRTSSTERHSTSGGRQRREAQNKTHGSILRHVILKGVAAQLVSARVCSFLLSLWILLVTEGPNPLREVLMDFQDLLCGDDVNISKIEILCYSLDSHYIPFVIHRWKCVQYWWSYLTRTELEQDYPQLWRWGISSVLAPVMVLSWYLNPRKHWSSA